MNNEFNSLALVMENNTLVFIFLDEDKQLVSSCNDHEGHINKEELNILLREAKDMFYADMSQFV